MTIGRRGPRVPRIGLRLALQLAGVSVLVCAIAGWVAWTQVHEALDTSVRDELQRMLNGGRDEIEMLRDRVSRSIDDAVESLEQDPSAMETLLLPSVAPGAAPRSLGDPVDAARRHRGTLDLFEVLDEDGSVLASIHEPERLHMRPGRLADAPENGPPMLLEDPSNPAVAIVMAGGRTFTYGSRIVRVRGGVLVDRSLLDRIARGERVLLLRAAADAPTVASTGAEELVEVAPSWIPRSATGSEAPVLQAAAGRWWLVDVKPLGSEPAAEPASDATGEEATRPAAFLVYAVDYSRVLSRLARLERTFAVLGLVVGGLAALTGALIARGVARPVDDVIRAFDAIAEGRADYTFDVRSPDAMLELPAAFSRTHRALEVQRRKSAAAERVAAWREVAQHLAHEVKNPLVPIRLTVENLVRARRQAPARFPTMFDDGMRTILEEVQQLSRIVSEFSEFARLPLPAPRPTALAPLIDRAIELHAAEPGLRIERHIDPETPPVPVDPDLVSRALKNIVANAVDAVREGSSKTGLEPTIEIRVRPVDGMAEIEVADNGPGLSEESVRHIFEPYFTTKPDGTGLGMTLTYRIIVDHGGTIVAENRGEGGARVVIRLPFDDGGDPEGSRPSEAQA